MLYADFMSVHPGEKYGRWTVTDRSVAGSKTRPRRVVCCCDCGNEKAIVPASLTSGKSRSCGCFKAEQNAENGRKSLKHPISVGDRFTRWVVLDASDRSAILCRCDCGVIRAVKATNLVLGKSSPEKGSQSCGCLRRDRISETHTKHATGYEDYRYRLWDSLLRRCYRENSADYAYYGARGISVYGPWHDAATFMIEIIEILGERPDGFTLDRIDNDGNYEPGNVRWASRQQQALNRRPRGSVKRLE